MKEKKITLYKLIPELLLQFAACFMLFIYAPAEFYFTDVDQFTYDVYDILRYMLPIFLIAFVLSAAVMIAVRLISKKIHDVVLTFYIIAFIATYIQGSYMSGFLPVLDGHEIAWESYSVQRVLSIILWVVIAAVIISAKRRLACENFAKFVSYAGILGVVLMLVTVGINGITVDKALKDKYNIAMSSGYLYDMSDDSNFVIFVVDAVDASTYEELREIHPEYDEYFKDFTYFPDTMGAYPYTSRSVPHMLYGKWYENEQGVYEYSSEALRESPLLNELRSRGYRLTMYMTDFLNIDGTLETFENLTKSERLSSPVKFIKMQMMFAGLRYMPFDLKPFCELTLDAIEEDSRRECSLGESYSMNNGWFYSHMNSTNVTRVKQKQFHYIHINGAHDPLEYDAEVNRIENGTYEQSVEASLTIAGTYIGKLRDSDAYDNTVIIVMADHGYGRGKEEPFDKQNPVLLIKGIDEKHLYSVSEAPVSYDDLQTAYSRLLDGASSEDAFDAKVGDIRKRRYLMMVHYDTSLHEYYQYGYASDEEAMKETGVVFPAI